MPWDAVSLAGNAMSCKIYQSLTLFDLQPIRGPYFIEVDIDGDENATKEELEVHFCNPVYQKEEKGSKRSLVFVRNTATTDNQAKRQARLTSGDNSFVSTNILYGNNDEVSGIELDVKVTSDDSKLALCKPDTPWSVTYSIMCDSKETGPLGYNKISVSKNSDKCTLRFTAIHKSGCGSVKASGFVQYLNS